MSSSTFTVGVKRVRIYTTKVKRPGGLAGIAWGGHDDANINVKINDTFYKDRGRIAAIKGGFYFYTRQDGIWRHMNTANKPVASFELAFVALVNYLKSELERSIFISAADLYDDVAASNLGIED